jgi:hypothetical protein
VKVDDGNVVDDCEYQCAGCKSTWNDKIYMVNHNVKNMNVFFCLNCSDWIRNKEAVFDADWTLFDEAGFLKQNV